VIPAMEGSMAFVQAYIWIVIKKAGRTCHVNTVY